MVLRAFHIDAFTDAIFKGNPASVVPLAHWLPDDVMAAMAAEHNLSETAFFVPRNDGSNIIDLRWFTPGGEIELCGHATLASAYVVFNELGHPGDVVHFHGRFKGDLFVRRDGDLLTLDFPAVDAVPTPMPQELVRAMGATPHTILRGDRNWYAVFDHADTVARMRPDFNVLAAHDARICATAPGGTCDFVSRFFLPDAGINEDPVTGSTHCALTPYWAKVTGKTAMEAQQLSARGGHLTVSLPSNARVHIGGKARRYARSEIFLPQYPTALTGF